VSFNRAVEVVLDIEGVLSDDKEDSGGLTKYGISQKAYPDLEISTLSKDEAIEIYRADYWGASRANLIPWPLSLYLFDAAVNQGRRPGTKLLQQALGVAPDGVIGPKTIAAANRAGPEQAALYLALRARRYAEHPKWDRYGTGWLKRLFRLVQQA